MTDGWTEAFTVPQSLKLEDNYCNILSAEIFTQDAMCLTLILLFMTTPTFANSADPDQMASEEAIRSGSTLFVIQFVNLKKKHMM